MRMVLFPFRALCRDPVAEVGPGTVDSGAGESDRPRMARRPARRRSRPGARARRWVRRLRRSWPGARRRRRWLRQFQRLPAVPRITVAGLALALAWAAINGAYQVTRKPTELFFPVSGTLHKSPAETWASYASVFRRHATPVITPDFLAALAQVEASGNPVARTYWRWSWSRHPLELWRPASSAVGMYQITDGTFEEARRYCIRDHAVAEEGPWHDWRSCWLNELYFRVLPTHAVELTSAYLDRAVRDTLAKNRIRRASRTQKQRLAALIHLCGRGAGNRFARRGLVLGADLRCGDHGARSYVLRVESMQRVFTALAARERDA
jgi:hypothetical protein